MLRDEIEFGKVVTWISLHPLKQKQRYKRLALKHFNWSHLSGYTINGLSYTLNQLKHYMNPRHQSKRYTIHICLPSSLLPTKLHAGA